MFSIFSKGKSKQPITTHRFNSSIWSIRLDISTPLRVLFELRDSESRQVEFQAFTLPDFQRVGILSEGDMWWAKPIAYNQNRLLAGFYEGSQSPSTIENQLYDLSVGKKQCIWKSNAGQIESVNTEVFSVLEDSTEHFYNWLGQEQASRNLSDQTNLFHQKAAQVYEEGTTYFKQVAAVIQMSTQLQPVGKVEYLEADALLIISFYCQNKEQTFDNHILVLDEEGDIKHHEIISTSKGLGFETFTYTNSHLLYVKDKIEAYCLDLARWANI